MACRAVERWTLTSLVGAYLDLVLIYLFLVGATMAFFASKLLAILGLSLPCSCDGRFGHPSCAQSSLLVDFPTARLAATHRSLRSRFPFNSILHTGASSPVCRCSVQYPSDDVDSCCSVSSLSARPRTPSISAPPLPADPTAEEPSALINGAHPHSGIQDSISDHDRILSVSAEMISGDPWDSDSDEAEHGGEKDSLYGVVGCRKEANLDSLRSLEMELEKEKVARAALYLDLEKERGAAASAADEAMAMILRLQKEKADIDMEARQYHRMIEEKYAYDAEEMQILKEIIVTREREKHVLEKEVQMYKNMVNSLRHVDQASDTDERFLKDKLHTLVDTSDDSLLMLQHIYESIGENEGFGEDSLPSLNPSGACSSDGKFVGVRNHVKLFNRGDDCDQEFQEKSMLTNVNPPFEAEYLKHITELTLSDKDEMVPTEVVQIVGSDDSNKRCESSQLKAEANILDVHVIDDNQVLQIKDDDNQNSIPEEDSSCINFDEVELNIRRSCSEISNRISLIDTLSRRASYFDLRSALPSVETKRSKLESEVEGLRNRLDVIREGREKLRLYGDQKENETFPLRLLDEIAGQLNEIKKATEPIKSLRRVSLPPPSTKIQVNCDI